MPTYPKHPCATSGCGNLVERGRARCDSCTSKRELADAEVRGTATERGYDHRWQAARARYLTEHPLCVVCQAAGRVTPARVVDHVIPHRGNEQLFWDESNWQALCDFTSPYNCHGRKTARGE